jgi:lysophospholipase L1-like esterase
MAKETLLGTTLHNKQRRDRGMGGSSFEGYLKVLKIRKWTIIKKWRISSEGTSRNGHHQEVHKVLSEIEPDTCIFNIGHNMC